MPAIPPPIDPRLFATGSGPLRTADGRPIDLVVAAGAMRSLLEVLKPGEVVTGRVMEQFANGAYLFTLRGRNLVAESAVPLLRDSAVQFQVLSTDGGGVRLRLVQDGPADRAVTTSFSGRLAALGLPEGPAGQAVLAAFEDAGAPLAAERLGRALADTATMTPAGAQARLAAHAALARAGLPATPALLAVAEQATRPGLPATAAAVQALNASLQVLTARAAATPTPPGPPAAGQTAAPAMAQPPALAATATAPPPSSTIALPPTIPLPDPGRDGVAAARQALLLAGLRPALPAATLDALDPRTASLPAAPSATAVHERLITHLAQAARAVADPPPGPTAPPPALADGAHAAVRQAVAEILLPPQRLADYDLVLPLALQNLGAPVPARLAVARRKTGSGAEAAFLRVDLDLERLGPLSIRISGLAGTPLSLLLLATGAALRDLEENRDAIVAALAAQGVTAGLRVSDLVQEVADG